MSRVNSPVRLKPDPTRNVNEGHPMKVARCGLLFLVAVASTASTAPAQQSLATSPLPLVITDKAAVEEWSRAVGGQQVLDPKFPADTLFLLSLNERELAGAFRFRQRCIVCHGITASLVPNTWGPILTRKNVEGREDAVRRQILEGSARMPAFKYALDAETIDLIIAYLKKVQTIP